MVAKRQVALQARTELNPARLKRASIFAAVFTGSCRVCVAGSAGAAPWAPRQSLQTRIAVDCSSFAQVTAPAVPPARMHTSLKISGASNRST